MSFRNKGEFLKVSTGAPARSKGAAANRLGAIGLLALMIAFALCTYYPPHCFLFEDPNTGGYGIGANAEK